MHWKGSHNHQALISYHGRRIGTVGDRKHPITANHLSRHRKGRDCKGQIAFGKDVIAATLCLYCLFVVSLWWKNWYGVCLYTSLVSCGREEE